jgi:hypothetical protein
MTALYFKLSPEETDTLLSVLQSTPLPHRVADPLIRKLFSQANDRELQRMLSDCDVPSLSESPVP